MLQGFLCWPIYGPKYTSPLFWVTRCRSEMLSAEKPELWQVESFKPGAGPGFNTLAFFANFQAFCNSIVFQQETKVCCLLVTVFFHLVEKSGMVETTSFCSSCRLEVMQCGWRDFKISLLTNSSCFSPLSLPTWPPHWGPKDAEIKAPSGENSA